jgi:hypothetical protein
VGEVAKVSVLGKPQKDWDEFLAGSYREGSGLNPRRLLKFAIPIALAVTVALICYNHFAA